MKQSTQQYFKDIRNLYHFLVAFPIGYLICVVLFSNREEFPLSWEYWNNYGYPGAAFVFVGFFAFLWEKRQDKIADSTSDMRDVILSAVSAFLGGYLAMIYSNLWIGIGLTVLALIWAYLHFKK